MNSLNAGLFSIEQAKDLYINSRQTNKPSNITENQVSFKDILSEKVSVSENVKFSKHANSRLESRSISLTDEQLNRLNQGVDKARTKNINESLVMMDDMAFIVNIKNNTVITAIDNKEDGVFTNIDGAVIV